MSQLLQVLKRSGFDLSKREDGAIRVGCSQCSPVVINGVPCHESGCPNERQAEIKRQREREREA